ncbi:hypothetical protein ACRRTK_012925 [Alexandromys fortis]
MSPYLKLSDRFENHTEGGCLGCSVLINTAGQKQWAVTSQEGIRSGVPWFAAEDTGTSPQPCSGLTSSTRHPQATVCLGTLPVAPGRHCPSPFSSS